MLQIVSAADLMRILNYSLQVAVVFVSSIILQSTTYLAFTDSISERCKSDGGEIVLKNFVFHCIDSTGASMWARFPSSVMLAFLFALLIPAFLIIQNKTVGAIQGSKKSSSVE